MSKNHENNTKNTIKKDFNQAMNVADILNN